MSGLSGTKGNGCGSFGVTSCGLRDDVGGVEGLDALLSLAQVVAPVLVPRYSSGASLPPVHSRLTIRSGRRRTWWSGIPRCLPHRLLVRSHSVPAGVGHGVESPARGGPDPVSYTHLRAHETKANLVC